MILVSIWVKVTLQIYYNWIPCPENSTIRDQEHISTCHTSEDMIFFFVAAILDFAPWRS